MPSLHVSGVKYLNLKFLVFFLNGWTCNRPDYGDHSRNQYNILISDNIFGVDFCFSIVLVRVLGHCLDGFDNFGNLEIGFIDSMFDPDLGLGRGYVR